MEQEEKEKILGDTIKGRNELVNAMSGSKTV